MAPKVSLTPNESKTRTSHWRDLDSLGDDATSLSNSKIAENDNPGCICGGTSVLNHLKTSDILDDAAEAQTR